MSGIWMDDWSAYRPKGELALTAYLAAPEPVKTGFGKLDQLLNGGMTKGVTVIGGPSSAGKSVLACQCAACIASSGRKVVYASYEMSWDVVQLRCASAWSCHQDNVESFSWSDVVSGKARRQRREYQNRTRQELSRIMVESPDPIVQALTAWDEGPGRNLAVVCGGESVTELTDNMRVVMRENPGTVLIVDYLQIVPPSDSKIHDEYERVTDVINNLQAYAMGEHGGNVIAISSTRKLTESDYKNGPSMDWFRGSGYIGYASEQAVMIVPDRENGKDENGNPVMKLSKNADGSINEKMTVVKNKSGMTDFSIAVKLYGNCNLFI